eukprot:9467701-Pyramimonas_sp.AAC.1
MQCGSSSKWGSRLSAARVRLTEMLQFLGVGIEIFEMVLRRDLILPLPLSRVDSRSCTLARLRMLIRLYFTGACTAANRDSSGYL